LADAERMLLDAQNSWRAERPEEAVDITARNSISAAVKAENTALIRKEAREKRNERTRADAETRQAEAKITDAENRMSDLRDELARETRNRELAERDAQNAANQVRELREENGRLREELGRIKLDAENLKTKIASDEAAKRAAQDENDKAAKAAKIKSAEAGLIAALKRFGTVSRLDQSIVLVLPETLWQGTRSGTFAMQSDGKLTSLAEILVNNPEYLLTIESHTDNTGSADTIQTLTDTRARRVAEKFNSLGVDERRIRAKGYGGTVPAVSGTTPSIKAKNRRVNVILDFDTR